MTENPLSLSPNPITLLPCPFCGGTNLWQADPHDNPGGDTWVTCENCKASCGSVSGSRAEDCTPIWNRRPSITCEMLDNESIMKEIEDALYQSGWVKGGVTIKEAAPIIYDNLKPYLATREPVSSADIASMDAAYELGKLEAKTPQQPVDCAKQQAKAIIERIWSVWYGDHRGDMPSDRFAITLGIAKQQIIDALRCSVEKSDKEMERVKACEHIAEGDMDGNNWRLLRNICPSTMAVAELRDKYEALFKRESIAPWQAAKKIAEQIFKMIPPEPEAVGRDDGGYPEYANDIDHGDAWLAFEVNKLLALINTQIEGGE